MTSPINSETREAWQNLANEASKNRPSVGKTVIVFTGKHINKTGIVFWHGVDKFNNPFRYATPAQAHLREINGRYGYCVGIKTENGSKFFTSAENVNVV